MFPVDLIEELFEKIVSCVEPQDVISLAETCRQAVVDVEAFARRELDRIEREHNVDDTWRFRVGMQAAQDAAARLSQEEENWQGMLVPNNISHRRMLRSAYRTYLYSLDSTMPDHPRVRGEAVAMHPNGKLLLSAVCANGHNRVIHLWDLSTQECIKSFPEQWVLNVGFSAGHIVSSSCSSDESTTYRVSIWSMDGTRKHCLTPLEGNSRARRGAFAVSNDSVYVVKMEGPIRVIDTITGTVRSMTEQPWGDHLFTFVGLGVCKSYLLHLRGDLIGTYTDKEVIDKTGVYIFDRDSEQLQSHFAGNYGSMTCSLDGDFMLYGGQIFQVQDGHLIPRFSLRSVLHMTKSLIFVRDKTPSDRRSWIALYNSENGMMERRLCCPTSFICSVTSNEREVFVGMEDNEWRNTIKAFLLH